MVVATAQLRQHYMRVYLQRVVYCAGVLTPQHTLLAVMHMALSMHLAAAGDHKPPRQGRNTF